MDKKQELAKHGKVICGFDTELGYYAELRDDSGAVVQQVNRAESRDRALDMLAAKLNGEAGTNQRDSVDPVIARLVTELDAAKNMLFACESLNGAVRSFLTARLAVLEGGEKSIEPWMWHIESGLQHAGYYLHQAKEALAKGSEEAFSSVILEGIMKRLELDMQQQKALIKLERAEIRNA